MRDSAAEATSAMFERKANAEREAGRGGGGGIHAGAVWMRWSEEADMRHPGMLLPFFKCQSVGVKRRKMAQKSTDAPITPLTAQIAAL